MTTAIEKGSPTDAKHKEASKKSPDKNKEPAEQPNDQEVTDALQKKKAEDSHKMVSPLAGRNV